MSQTTPTARFADRAWKHWTEPELRTVDGREIAFRRKGVGEPLLYLHGAGLTRQWLPLYEKLAERFDVIVPEHPGFGDSPTSESIGSFSDLVLHYDAVLRDLGVESPHLVGHSMGGWLAADLAVFYPGRFRSLTLLGAIGLRTPGVSPADPFRWGPEATDEHVLNGLGARYVEYLEQDGGVEDTIREYGESITFARLTWNPRYDVRLEWRLGRVQAPTKVIHFADDRYVPVELSRRYAELIPGASLVLLPGADGEPASHVAIIQQPETIAALIGAHELSRGVGR